MDHRRFCMPPAAAACLFFSTCAAWAQTPPGHTAAAGQAPNRASVAGLAAVVQEQSVSPQLPVYDVVSIKPHKDEGMNMRAGIGITPDGVEMNGLPLQMIMKHAFGLSEDRILNEPDWVRSTRYDIQAKVAPDDAPKLKPLSMEQRAAMMLPVLEERFGLKFHHETRDLQVYTLLVAKGGPKLKEAGAGEAGSGVAPPPMFLSPDGGEPGGMKSSGGARDSAGHTRMTMRVSPQGLTWDGHGTSTASLAQMISQQVDATVMDKTGLTGSYDFTLSFTPDNFVASGRTSGASGGGGPDGAVSEQGEGPSIFTALQEQLGLKLEARKEQVDVIVIDQIDQPTPN